MRVGQFEIKGHCGRGARTNRGVTILEFLACITAVLGGMWLGALYLGVNVEHLAHTALEQAQLLDSVPPPLRPEGPKQNVVTREQLVATLRKEIGSLRSEILALHAGENARSNATTQMSEAAALAKNNTRSYWLRLNEIALSEEQLQREAATAINNENVASVFAIKGRVCRFAAKSVQAVPTENVDEAVLKFGRQLTLWYDKGGELYEQAVQIWESPAGPQAREQLTAEWKQAEKQHQHEARLLRERAASVRGSISRQFSEEFPDFATPPVAAAPAEAKPVEEKTS